MLLLICQHVLTVWVEEFAIQHDFIVPALTKHYNGAFPADHVKLEPRVMPWSALIEETGYILCSIEAAWYLF